MSRRLVWPLLFGILGFAVLVGLGLWQVQRLEWKQGVLAGMEARLSGTAMPLPAEPDPEADLYQLVEVQGRFLKEAVFVMDSQKLVGPGYRLISGFETVEGRRIMVDRGFIPVEARDVQRAEGAATILGNLHWPQETDGFTPDPDREERLWFARDVPSMAAELGTEEVLVVLRDSDEAQPAAQAMPLDTARVPNNHLGYAVTWFSLAIVWAGMTLVLLWRIRRQTTAG